MNIRLIILLPCLLCRPWIAAAESPTKPLLKTEHFDHDPGWEGHHNHVIPKDIKTVRQEFGYSATQFAGKAKGELGGTIWRSSVPCFYADRIKVKTLNDKLTASGTFAVTRCDNSAGVSFGWLNSKQDPGRGRAINYLGLDLDFEATGGRLFARLFNGANHGCGACAQPYIHFNKPILIKADGTRYAWKLAYEPEANRGNGQFKFIYKSNADAPLSFEGKTVLTPEETTAIRSANMTDPRQFEDQVLTVNLPAGIKAEGATFDRFGLINIMKDGNAADIYFDDLEYDGKREEFSKDPKWDGVSNRAAYPEALQKGAHDFGFRAQTNQAGGSPGEVGGTFWNVSEDGGYAYFADKIGALSLNDRLEASGRLIMPVGAPDSEMSLGWFNSAVKNQPPDSVAGIEVLARKLAGEAKKNGDKDKTDFKKIATEQNRPPGNFLGIKVKIVARLGHLFLPLCVTGKGTTVFTTVKPIAGPVVVPGKVFDWSLLYDPQSNDGKGSIRVTLGDETATLDLEPEHKTEGATFDRFGFLTGDSGGQLMTICFDDLKYTAGKP